MSILLCIYNLSIGDFWVLLYRLVSLFGGLFSYYFYYLILIIMFKVFWIYIYIYILSKLFNDSLIRFVFFLINVI